MHMTNDEIVNLYRQAKSPVKQIGILAQLNLCTRQKIVDILIEAGCEVPKKYQTGIKTSEAPAQKQTAEHEHKWRCCGVAPGGRTYTYICDKCGTIMRRTSD